ncbi:hypothetical protein C8Q75DRAFT_393195 [Abortiporus biennis]|nr:hypothetical protein C8Q75DRAFT_393195 [Abortiporus biennis]
MCKRIGDGMVRLVWYADSNKSEETLKRATDPERISRLQGILGIDEPPTWICPTKYINSSCLILLATYRSLRRPLVKSSFKILILRLSSSCVDVLSLACAKLVDPGHLPFRLGHVSVKKTMYTDCLVSALYKLPSRCVYATGIFVILRDTTRWVCRIHFSNINSKKAEYHRYHILEGKIFLHRAPTRTRSSFTSFKIQEPSLE